MATIQKRGNAWRAFVLHNGKRYSATRDTKAEAKAWAIQCKSDLIRQADAVESPHNAGHTVADALILYRDTITVNKRGARWETIRINKFLRELPFRDAPVAELQPAAIAAWRDAQLSSLAPASVSREMAVLSAVLDVCRREWGWMKHDPIRDVRKPQKPKPRDRLVLEHEREAMLRELGYMDGIPIETHQQQIAVGWLLALETAMRAGEIFGLEWKRVNMPKRFVRLAETKNGDARDVPLSARAAELLEAMRGIDRERVFTVDSQVASTLFRRARIRAKIDDLTFHDSRHDAITRLAQKLNVLQLARMVGHRDIRSLQTYYNETAESMARLL